jgi:hypothetical protein
MLRGKTANDKDLPVAQKQKAIKEKGGPRQAKKTQRIRKYKVMKGSEQRAQQGGTKQAHNKKGNAGKCQEGHNGIFRIPAVGLGEATASQRR